MANVLVVTSSKLTRTAFTTWLSKLWLKFDNVNVAGTRASRELTYTYSRSNERNSEAHLILPSYGKVARDIRRHQETPLSYASIEM